MDSIATAPRRGPKTAYPGKIRAHPVSIGLTPLGRRLLSDLARRLGLSWADVTERAIRELAAREGIESPPVVGESPTDH